MKKLWIVGALALAAACNNNAEETSTGADSTAMNGDSASAAAKPALYLNLPDTCNTPDGLAFSADSQILYLSMPNLNDPTHAGWIYTIEHDSLKPLLAAPLLGKAHTAPMDLAVGPDGNLYINDNQFELGNTNYESRLLRVVMKDGKPVRSEVVVDGFRLANGMVWKGSNLYITDSQWDMPQDTAKSAIFRFNVSEFGAKPIMLQPGFSDKHILDTFTTIIGTDKLDNGVDGIDYDSKGALYTGMFGDGRVFKLSLSGDGTKVESKTVLVPKGPIASVDGFITDRGTDKLYIADAKRNAIKVVDAATGNVSTLWSNGDTNGSDGGLDQPAEVLLRGNKLYVSNFDKPSTAEFTNAKFDAPYTLSVITVPGK